MADYVERSIDPVLSELMRELPALLLTGPRATGKTTTASRHAKTIVHLDRRVEATAFQADPDAALRDLPEPVLLDEWQAVPEILGAVKRTVDADPRAGRFLLTGSVRADLDAATWPGTGRVVRLALYGLTVAEQSRRPATPLFDRLARREPLGAPSDPPDLRGYIELALRGGFPEAALALSESARQRWLESYVDQLVTRDARDADGERNPVLLRRYLEAYALHTAGITESKRLADSASINQKTADRYEQLLANLMVIDRVPAWATNRLKRLVRGPKRYLIDPALLSGILRVDVNAVMRDGNLLGRVLDTFVAAQLRSEVPLAASRPRIYHLRQAEGRREIDLIAELGGGQVVGIEVEADAGPTSTDAKHLGWLRDQLGERFTAGVVLHTGPRPYQLDDRITAAPICSIWSD
ncbi:MAG: ATP-binding protein [Acidimicrobiales bacterium]